MIDSILFFGLLLLFFPLAYFIVPAIRNHLLKKVIFCTVLGLILIPVTLFYLPQFAALMPAQNIFLDKVIGWRERMTSADERKEFCKNFFFIDVANTNELIPKPGANIKGSSTEVITDRKKLAMVLNFLNDSTSLVDLIICDIYFDLSAPADSLLRSALIQRNIENKLILAYNPQHSNSSLFANLSPSLFGIITEESSTSLFSHFTVNKEIPSLPSAIASRISGKSENYMMNTFLPAFHFRDEAELFGTGDADDEFVGEISQLELGDVVHTDGKNNLYRILNQRKKEGRKNYIIIGDISGKGDVHDTFFGKLHGPAILLNIAYDILEGEPKLDLWFLCYLWFTFSVIIYLLISSAIRENKSEALPKKRGLISSLVPAFRIVFIEELHYWLLICFVLTTALCFDKLLNGFGLLILFAILYKSFAAVTQNTSGS